MADASVLRIEKEVREMADKRPYKRTKPQPTRLALNEFQRDVVLGALTREIRAVRDNKDVPNSLRILALEQLEVVIAQLQPIETSDDDSKS